MSSIAVAVVGAAGRMGTQACAAVEAADGLELVARITSGDDVGARVRESALRSPWTSRSRR